MKCKMCKRDTENPRFCSRSCSQSYNNKFRTKDRGQCLNCGTKLVLGQYKFCSGECNGEYLYKTVSIPKILVGESDNVDAIKRYLAETRGNICSICDNKGVHNHQPLVLQLDHIDGNSDNNQLENLRLLCPNCHSQTPTFTTRQKKDTRRNRYLRKLKGYAP